MKASYFVVTLAMLLSSAAVMRIGASSSSSIPAWATMSSLPAPPSFPPPSTSLSLVIYGSLQSTCIINSTTTTIINNWCAVQTPSLVTSSNLCTLFAITPSLPANTANTALAYMFDSSYNLNIYSVSAVGTVSCSASNLLINITNPQWNYASSCSTRSLTTFYQFAYQNGQSAVTNGSMLMDASGLGYGVCPYGYFWPTQPACDASPSVSTTSASTLPLNSSNLSPSFVAPTCSMTAQSASYSMALTVGVNNACPTGCDGTNFRVCMNSMRVCVNTAGHNLNKQCVCFQDGLNLCAKVANVCPDSYANFAMNQYYQQAVSACSSVGMSLTLSFQPSTSSSSVCTDCSPAIAFAVVFALLFGGLFAYIAYFRYYAHAMQPLQQMRQTALSR